MSKGSNLLGYQPNFTNIERLIEEKLVNKVVHPENSDLVLYNHSKSAQFCKKWTKDLMICRRLVVKEGEIVSRPFPKFFNHFEYPPSSNNILKGPWKVHEKMDGSLGILYEFAKGDYRICTRGSFEGVQATWATKHLKEFYPEFVPEKGVTYLFEIIYPDNRIVVDYGDKEALVLLDTLYTADGARVFPKLVTPFEEANVKGIVDKISELEAWEAGISNEEGYVLEKANFRVKFKHKEYFRRHVIRFNLSTYAIWEMLKEGEDIETVLEEIPDEFHDWASKQVQDIRRAYYNLIQTPQHVGSNVPSSVIEEGRKAVWEYVSQYTANPHIAMAYYDGKKLGKSVWNQVKPPLSYPEFK